MFVCICKTVTEKEIEKTIAEGARNISEIQKKCSAGSHCGKCIKKIKAKLASER